MIRIIAKIFAVTVFLTAFLHIAPLFAASVTYISSTGDDANPCTAAQPCATFFWASVPLTSNGQISCLNSPGLSEGGVGISLTSITIDCAGVYQVITPDFGAFRFGGVNRTVTIRNLTISGTSGGWPAIKFIGGGTLILENCVFENFSGTALDIEPNSPLNLVITNSRVSNGSTVAIVLGPAAGGSINATFDHVTVTKNGGGGIRLDTTNGPVTADVTDSVITNNTGNGLSAQGGAGGAAMLSIHNSVIAKNGAAGINATGANGAAMVDTTLLDSNASGATSVVAGGHMLTYVNNRIVGPVGAGFTATASPQ